MPHVIVKLWPGRSETQKHKLADRIARLRPHLASKYAPLTPDGNGLQSVYLTKISRGFAWVPD